MNTVSVVALPATASMSPSRLLGAYWAEARHEIVRTLRNPAFAIPTIALPVMLYVFFVWCSPVEVGLSIRNSRCER